MKRYDKWMLAAVWLVCIVFPVVMALGIDWIQSNERVVGEGHPTYTDVVNRPMKQIWGVYTSEHATTGVHKTPYTPLSTFQTAHNADGSHQFNINDYLVKTTFWVAHQPDGSHLFNINEYLTKTTFQTAHNADGSHIASQIDHNQLANYDAAQHIDWTNASADFSTTGEVYLNERPIHPPVITSASVPLLPFGTMSFWRDEYSGQFWLVVNIGGEQRKVELLP